MMGVYSFSHFNIFVPKVRKGYLLYSWIAIYFFPWIVQEKKGVTIIISDQEELKEWTLWNGNWILEVLNLPNCWDDS